MKLSIEQIIILPLICGSLMLAAIDPNARPMFYDLTKVAVGSYIVISKNKSKKTD